MFDPEATPHMPVSVGDEVRFKSISKDEFISLGGEVEALGLKDKEDSGETL